MADALGLTWEQRCLLLGIPRTTYHRWVANGVGTLDRDKRDRLAYLLAIYHYAGTAFPGGGGAKGWLTRPNTHPTFDGIRPLDRMLKGGMDDLLAVHQVARAAATKPCTLPTATPKGEPLGWLQSGRGRPGGL